MDHRGDTVAQDREEIFATFSTRLAAAGGIAHRVASLDEAAAAIVGILASIPVVAPDLVSGDKEPASARQDDDGGGVDPTIWASSRVIDEQPELITALERQGRAVRVPDDPATVRDEPLGLAVARMAIAETGSVLLHEPTIADRSVSLMTNVLIAICPLEVLRPSLDDAAPVLREISRANGSYATLVTGPSRTADIERQLTVGVQGPAEMHVIFVPGRDENDIL